MIPRPQMIVDRKWSREKLRNGIDLTCILDEEWGCLQRNMGGKKGIIILLAI